MHQIVIDKYTMAPSKIRRFPLKRESILNRTVIVYGAPNSGKSTLAKYLLSFIKDDIAVPIVVSATENLNNTFSGWVPDHFRYSSIQSFLDVQHLRSVRTSDLLHGANTKLTQIYNRQKILTQTFTTVNSLSCLETCRPFLPIQDQLEISRAASDDELVEVYKRAILASREKLLSMPLADKTRFLVSNIDINPNLLLIFDDIASDLNIMSKSNRFKDLFHSGRHYNITTIILCQYATQLSPDIRKSCRLSIFTDFNDLHFKFDKDEPRPIQRLLFELDMESVFSTTQYRFIAYDIDEAGASKFGYIDSAVVPEPESPMGSASVSNFCKKVTLRRHSKIDHLLDIQDRYIEKFIFDAPQQ